MSNETGKQLKEFLVNDFCVRRRRAFLQHDFVSFCILAADYNLNLWVSHILIERICPYNTVAHFGGRVRQPFDPQSLQGLPGLEVVSMGYW